MKYKFIDAIKSDVMFEAYGKDLKELFENAALAVFDVMCDLKKVRPKTAEKFEIKGEDLESLMFNWLSGLIAIVDTEQMFFSQIKIKEINENKLIAELKGESISPEKGKTVVKAVTYYCFKIDKTKAGYKVKVSLDI